MRRVGETVRVAQRLAVVRVPENADPPDIGASVVDESLTDVGEIVDVFGPVERPYVAVSPRDGVSLPGLVGERLYVR